MTEKEQNGQQEKARNQLRRRATLSGVVISAIAVVVQCLLWFAWVSRAISGSETYIGLFLYVAPCVFADVFVFALGVAACAWWDDKKNISSLQIEEIEVWRRNPVAMQTQAGVEGSVHGVCLLGFGYVDGNIDSKPEYRYLYDTGYGFELASIPAGQTRIYPIEENETPYIIHWRENFYYESLLRNPPSRLPSGYRKKCDERMVPKEGYSVYVPESSIRNGINLV